MSIIDIIQNLTKFNEILSFFKKNAPLSDHHNIALLLYNDDIELCNPTGRGMNKICLFYVTVLNIPVQL